MSDKWQPIETANKRDYIIGVWKDGKWQAAELWFNDAEEEWNHTTGDHICRPTHWMPLPEPPK